MKTIAPAVLLTSRGCCNCQFVSIVLDLQTQTVTALLLPLRSSSTKVKVLSWFESIIAFFNEIKTFVFIAYLAL